MCRLFECCRLWGLETWVGGCSTSLFTKLPLWPASRSASRISASRRLKRFEMCGAGVWQCRPLYRTISTSINSRGGSGTRCTAQTCRQNRYWRYRYRLHWSHSTIKKIFLQSLLPLMLGWHENGVVTWVLKFPGEWRQCFAIHLEWNVLCLADLPHRALVCGVTFYYTIPSLVIKPASGEVAVCRKICRRWPERRRRAGRGEHGPFLYRRCTKYRYLSASHRRSVADFIDFKITLIDVNRSSPNTTLTRFRTTVAAPPEIRVSSKLKGHLFVDLRNCTLYAWISGSRYLSQYIWSQDTWWRNREIRVELKRCAWPLVFRGYSVVLILLIPMVLRTATKNLNTNWQPL